MVIDEKAVNAIYEFVFALSEQVEYRLTPSEWKKKEEENKQSFVRFVDILRYNIIAFTRFGEFC